MKKLVVMMLVVAVTLFVGALSGVQHMNEELGISQPEPLKVWEKAEKKSKTYTEVNELIVKKERMEAVERFNFFSDLGSAVADGVNGISRTVLSQVMSFVRTVLNGEDYDEPN